MRLNIGAGKWRPDGWLSVDLNGDADVQHDLGQLPWPFESGSASEILASHILEHFDRDTGLRFLRECHRVLAPRGQLHLAVPDMDRFIECRNREDYSELGGYSWTNLNDLLGGGNAELRPELRHRYMYCFASLAWSLQRSGLMGTRRGMREFDNPEYEAISLYMTALK